MKGKLLWLGDAVAATGFSRITHKVLDVLRHQWDVSVLGINYWGDPHDYPYPIYPAARGYGDDPFGMKRLGKVLTELKPDVCVILTDPWHMPKYLAEAGNCPVVASVMVDGLNCRGAGMNGSAAVIFPTEFGLEQAQVGGYQGKAAVIPLGVDLEIYKQLDRVHSRKSLGLPPALHEGGYIVGNVNRNQPRKRLDLTVRYFARWVREHEREDAYLYLHVAPTKDQGWDLGQLAQYYGVASRLIYAEPNMLTGVTEAALNAIYNAFDVQVTTTQGEGFGLPTLEGMAAGVPQIVPAWAALEEFTGEAALHVPCTTTAATPNMINAIGGLPDEDQFIACLERLYQEPDTRRELGAAGMSIAGQDCYRWQRIGEMYGSVIDQALNPVTRFSGAATHGDENDTRGGGRDAGEAARHRAADAGAS